MEISLENLKKEIAGLEYFVEETDSNLQNVLERLDRVKKMSEMLEKQQEASILNSKKNE